MELKQLQAFMAVVEEGTISAAAKRLHMAQPPLSCQMKSLEEELGTLFWRGARHIT
ncbi:MAG: LysR family transcriptional regulator [Christensenellales bacterium]